MFKKIHVLFLFGLLLSTSVLAQTGSITGTVLDATSGDPIPSATVQIVELQRGTATDIDGNYSITNLPTGSYTLRASFVGYQVFETPVNIGSGETQLSIELEQDLLGLDALVVTAFGVTREEKSLGYAVQSVSGEEVTMVDDANIVGALSGKVAGVQVIGAAGGNLGGSEKIRIRGTNGLGDGQPLFVVDGTPISNSSFSSSVGTRDYGNLAQDLNLQDVADISVLKGAAASVLYGNRASNGVILITTKKGRQGENQPIQVDFSNTTSFERVYILPDYQNEYGGGYTQDFIPYVDPEDGQTYNILNYAADESWGPKMDGTMYRPWWSWYHNDWDGDGVDDYGTTIPLSPNPDNVRDFYDTGVSMKNSISINGGTSNSAFRVSLANSNQTGVVPNASLEKTYLNFNGSLSHSDKFTSRISFNYVNTQGDGRPRQGYTGSISQSFNQWFQRQLDMSYLENYNTPVGLASWNIRSPTNLRPLYWDSPYFSLYENYANDSRDRIYGNYSMSYNINSNFEVTGKLHLDTYSFTVEDRTASGGLDQDGYSTIQRANREVNYELGVNYSQDFDQISVNGFAGGNIRQNRYNSVFVGTSGGLNTPNYFNINASVDRPNVNNTIRNQDVRSLFGTLTVGYADMIYLEGSVRNDWSSTLPKDNNSYLYYGVSASLVFTELGALKNQDFLSFGKLRASIAQVGDDIAPYSISSTYNVGTPYGSMATQSVPNTLNNPNVVAAINTDYEVGMDVRFLQGKVRLDAAYYISKREDEILNLSVSGASGFSSATINAGEFTTTGVETALGVTALQTADLNVDFTLNWATSHSVVDKLADGLTVREIEDAYFGTSLYAKEGEEWGLAAAENAYTYVYNDNGDRVVDTAIGFWDRELNGEMGYILPDWTGGFRTDVSYKNFSFGAFIDFQKGGQFYSISKMFGAYSGLDEITVGNNVLGNPLRDPVLDSGGNEVTWIPLADAASNSGGVLIEGVDASGQPAQILRNSVSYWGNMYAVKDEWMYDASFIKLREVSVTYNLPGSMLSTLPLRRASISLNAKNLWLIYASTTGVDPSTVQNGTTGFSFWEGGGLPGTRSVGFSVNLGF